jgi:trimeric autotransporter adhesin
MKKLTAFFFAWAIAITPVFLRAQVAISSDNSAPHPSAMLDVKSTDKGLLVPRMTSEQRTAMIDPAEGIMVYDTDLHAIFIYYDQWRMCLTGSTGWQVNGNSATLPSLNFLGTTDNVALKFRVNNIAAGFIDPVTDNAAFGNEALGNNPSGKCNTAIGALALTNTSDGWFNVAVGYGSAFRNSGGSNNVGIGANTMPENTSGNDNLAIGFQALNSNTSGSSNVALGKYALFSGTNQSNNIAIGDSALYYNGTGASAGYQSVCNTAIGSKALALNTTGFGNTVTGYKSLYSNTIGVCNTVSGCMACYSNTSGGNNTASGYHALYSNTAGSENVATGFLALASNQLGSGNVAIGISVLENHKHGDHNTAMGYNAMGFDTCGQSNVAIGCLALYYSRNRSHLVAVGDSALFLNGFYTTNSQDATGNTALGSKALALNTIGYYNTATGYQALYSNSGGYENTADGYAALYSNSGGYYNSAFGFMALNSNSGGHHNTAIGFMALSLNISGISNTAVGCAALHSNSANSNTALSYNASYSNSTGTYNIAIGNEALYFNQTGNENVVIGPEAGFGAMNGSFSNNTILGCKAGRALSSGASNNILIGHMAGDNLTTGANNIILGYEIDATSAGKSNEMILGHPDLLYGDITNKRIGIGTTAPICQLHIQSNGDAMVLIKADADNVNEDDNPRLEMRQDGASVVGALGYCGSDNYPYPNMIGNGLYLVNEYNSSLQFGTDSTVTMTIMGNGRVGILNNNPEQALHVTGSAKISSLAVNGPVYSNNGVLTNTNPSDMRLKDDIESIDNSLERVMQLRPVTFTWKSDGKQGIGFIAQEMENVIPDLVVTGEDGYKGIYTVEMIPFLVKALQEQQAMIDELQRKVSELQEK